MSRIDDALANIELRAAREGAMMVPDFLLDIIREEMERAMKATNPRPETLWWRAGHPDCTDCVDVEGDLICTMNCSSAPVVRGYRK